MQAALAALPGVRHVAVDFENKQAVVTITQDDYDERKLIQALKDAGFGGSVKRNWNAVSLHDQNPASLLPKADTGADGQTAYSTRAFGRHLQVSAQLGRDIMRPGDAFRLAVVFEIDKGWHIYGNPVGPGVGKKTVIAAHSPDGFEFDVARYALGEKEEQDFGEAGSTWVWQNTGKTVHYLTGKVPEKVQPGEYEWTIEASAQVCDPKTCLPGKAIVRIPITVASQGTPSSSINEELFVGFTAAKVPQANVDQ